MALRPRPTNFTSHQYHVKHDGSGKPWPPKKRTFDARELNPKRI